MAEDAARHIGILTSVHGPYDTRIFHKEAVSLARAGYRVSLVVPGEPLPPRSDVTFVPVRRERTRWRRIVLTPWRVLGAALRLDADVYHLHDPELLFVGLALRLRGRRVIYDAHEDVARDVLAKPWVPQPLRRPLSAVVGAIEHWVARRLDAVIVARSDIAPAFGSSAVVVENHPPRAMTASADAAGALPRATGGVSVLYAGSASDDRGLFQMLAAMAQLPADLPVSLDLVGVFSPPGCEDSARRHPGAARARFHGQVDFARMPAVLQGADIGIVCFQPDPNNINSGPTKLFEYMAAGLPVIASDFPEWRRVVEGSGAGIVVDPTRPDRIAEAIERLARDAALRRAMGDRARRAVLATYNWERQAEALLDLYRRVLAAR